MRITSERVEGEGWRDQGSNPGHHDMSQESESQEVYDGGSHGMRCFLSFKHAMTVIHINIINLRL